MAAHLDSILSVLNGAIGDYLERTDNSLATTMQLIHDGAPLVVTSNAITAAHHPVGPTPRVAVLVHGLMSTERAWNMADGSNYGMLLARDLGYTPFYVRYNTGLHISDNGDALDALLERLVAHYPCNIDELILIGHSMGGLVIRSATHAAAGSATPRRWLALVKRAFYLGTPHLGAPLERAGNAVAWLLKSIPNPYTSLIADLANLRSSGVKDLRYANLRREDWDNGDVDALLQNRRHPVPLLPHIRHHLIAGAVAKHPALSLLFGDAIVPLRSATGRAKPADRSPAFPQEHMRIMSALNHPRLACDAAVYDQVRAWCEEPCV